MSRIFHLCTFFFFFFSSRRRHTRSDRDWSSDVCSSDLSLPCRAADAFRHAPLETLSPRPVEAPLREGGDQALPSPLARSTRSPARERAWTSRRACRSAPTLSRRPATSSAAVTSPTYQSP